MPAWDTMTDEQRNLEVEVRIFGEKRLSESEMRAEAESIWRDQPACQHFWMGFSVRYSENNTPEFVQQRRNFTGDARCDYFVLEKVRSEWAYEIRVVFGRYLEAIWLGRFDEQSSDPEQPQRALQILLCQFYQPGDYARAACEVLRNL